MSLLFIDGFDHYNVSQAPRKWTGLTGTTFCAMTTGRYSGQAVQRTTSGSGTNNNTFYTTITPTTTIVVGFAINIAGGGTNGAWGEPMIWSNSSGLNHCMLRIENTGAITAYKGTTTVLNTSATGVFTTGSTWYYIEWKVNLSTSTSGSYSVKVDGNTVLSGSGIITTPSAITSGLRVTVGPFGWNSVTFNIDDLYILDSGGTFNNDFRGPCRVATSYPRAVGNSTQWTPTGNANNYAAAAEHPADDDTSYIATSTTSAIDLYQFDTVPSLTSNIYGVQTNLEARIDDAGPHSIRDVVRSGGTTYDGSTVSPAASYAILPHLWESDPATSTLWTPSGVNSAQFGAKLIS